MQEIADACGLEVNEAYGAWGSNSSREERAGIQGGNIEGGPGGSCVIGSFGSDEQWDKLADEVCGDAPRLKVDTSFLKVGHVDQLFSTIRTGPGKCDIAVLIANPKEAYSAMKRHPGELALPIVETNLEKEEEYSRLYPKYYRGTCDSLSLSRTEQEAFQNLSNTLEEVFTALSTTASSSETSCREAPPESRSACLEEVSKVTNERLLRAVAQDAKARDLNQQLLKQAQFLRKSFSNLATQAGCPDLKVVDMPVLLQASKVPGSSPEIKATEVFANVVNMQQFGNALLVPDPGNAGMKKLILEKIHALGAGLKVEFIDSQFAHIADGGIHCSINAVRYCRPPGRAQ